jgi:hypothetical protein
MDRKIFERTKKFYENMTTPELLEIWVNNDQDTYPLRDFQAVKLLLQMRNQEIPEQKEYIASNVEEYPQDIVNRLIKGAVIFLFIFGVFNAIYWYFGCAVERHEMLSRFSEVKFLLGVRLYGQIVISIIIILSGITFLLFKQIQIVLLISGILLCFSGLWNLFSDFIAIPAFAQYGLKIDIYNVLNGFKYFLYIVSVLQIRWGFNQVRDFIKIKNLSLNKSEI